MSSPPGLNENFEKKTFPHPEVAQMKALNSLGILRPKLIT